MDGAALKTVIVIIIVQIVFILSGCRNMYEGFRTLRAEDCYRLPYPEQGECLRQTDVGYEEYEANREELRRRH